MKADDLTELFNTINLLSPEELSVLKRLKPARAVVVEELASELYDLPTNISRAIDKLKAALLVKAAPTGRSNQEGVLLTDTGLKVRKILSVNEDEQMEKASLPRYRA